MQVFYSIMQKYGLTDCNNESLFYMYIHIKTTVTLHQLEINDQQN